MPGKPITAFRRCHALGLTFVRTASGEHEGFGMDDVAKAIPAEIEKLTTFLADKTLFTCGHCRDAKNVEIPCVRAADLESFLEAN